MYARSPKKNEYDENMMLDLGDLSGSDQGKQISLPKHLLVVGLRPQPQLAATATAPTALETNLKVNNDHRSLFGSTNLLIQILGLACNFQGLHVTFKVCNLLFAFMQF